MHCCRLLLAVAIPPALLGLLIWTDSATTVKREVDLYEHVRQIDMDTDEAMFVLDNALNCEKAVVVFYADWDLTAMMVLKNLESIQDELAEYPAAQDVHLHFLDVTDGTAVPKLKERLNYQWRYMGTHSFLFLQSGEVLGQESRLIRKDDPQQFLSLFDKYYGATEFSRK